MSKVDKKSKTLTIVIIAILGLWAVAIGAFLSLHRTGSISEVSAPQPQSGAASGDIELWNGIYQGRTKIGYSYSRLQPVEEGFRISSFSRIRLSLLETVQEIKLNLQALLGSDYSVREVEFEALSGFMEIRARGRVDGDEMVLKIDTGGEEVEKRLTLKKPPTLEMTWQLRDSLKHAAMGNKLEFDIFEPLTQTELPVSVEVVGEEDVVLSGGTVHALKALVMVANQSQWMWVTPGDGEVVKEYHPGTGLMSLLEDREEALDVDWERAGGLDIITTLMVASSVPIGDPREVGFLRARLVKAPLSGLDLELAGRQTAEGSTVEVSRGEVPARGYALPFADSFPGLSDEFSEWLSPTAMIQSGHPRIEEAAQAARGDATDAVTAVERIVSWMGEEISPSLVVSVPSALEVLEQRRGACKEHAILFTALCRASGIPARMVAGIVYSDEQIVDGFYYHAWSEVYLSGPQGGGGWVAVDPTFHQFPADATHIRLKEGGLEHMIDLMQVIGTLEVDVGDYH